MAPADSRIDDAAELRRVAKVRDCDHFRLVDAWREYLGNAMWLTLTRGESIDILTRIVNEASSQLAGLVTIAKIRNLDGETEQ